MSISSQDILESGIGNIGVGAIRTAVAAGRMEMAPDIIEKIQTRQITKGDVLTYAEVTAILGAKQTATLLPYARPNSLSDIVLEFDAETEKGVIEVKAFVKAKGPVGVQMEAMMAVSLACLTIFEMCKSESQEIRIRDIELLSKTGGESGDFRRN